MLIIRIIEAAFGSKRDFPLDFLDISEPHLVLMKRRNISSEPIAAKNHDTDSDDEISSTNQRFHVVHRDRIGRRRKIIFRLRFLAFVRCGRWLFLGRATLGSTGLFLTLTGFHFDYANKRHQKGITDKVEIILQTEARGEGKWEVEDGNICHATRAVATQVPCLRYFRNKIFNSGELLVNHVLVWVC